MPNILLVGLCGVQVILARYNTFVDLYNLVFNNKILYVINSVVGATVIILILKNLNVKSRYAWIYIGNRFNDTDYVNGGTVNIYNS